MTNKGSRLILNAEKKRDAAWRDLDRAVTQVFPVGTRVVVRMGLATVEGTVRATHGADHWSDSEAGYVYITNDFTGKPRKFHAPSTIANGHVRIVEAP